MTEKNEKKIEEILCHHKKYGKDFYFFCVKIKKNKNVALVIFTSLGRFSKFFGFVVWKFLFCCTKIKINFLFL